MSERLRLYQLSFEDQFHFPPSQDVTPSWLTHLEFPCSQSSEALDRSEPSLSRPGLLAGRFVREPQEPCQVISPEVAAEYLIQHVYTPFAACDQEELWTLLLDNRNWITHEVMVYRGTINTVTVRTAEIVKEAVRVNAVALILSHVHPSGDPSPSPEDVQVTRRVGEAAALLDIELLDHLIIGNDRWVSLKERGLGF